MKRIISILLSALMLVSLGGCKPPADAGEPDSGNVTEAPDGEVKQPTEAPAAETEAPADATPIPTAVPDPDAARLALLPDWEAEDTSAEWVTYKRISTPQVNEYAARLEEEGFERIVFHEQGTEPRYLYRQDALVEISEHYDAEGTCAVKVTVNRHEGGVDRGAMKAAAEEWYRTENNKEAQVVYVIETTPKGFFEATGLQRFSVLFNDVGYSGASFITANGELASADRFRDIAAADIDGDGICEAVALEFGPTSGLFSQVFEAFCAEDGKLVRKGVSGYVMDAGKTSLTVRDGNAFFVWEGQVRDPETNEWGFAEPREFPLTLEGGRLTFDDPENAAKAGYLEGFDWKD